MCRNIVNVVTIEQMVHALCGQSGVSVCFTGLEDNLKRSVRLSRPNNFRPRFKFFKLVLFSGCRIKGLDENEGLQPEDAILLASATQYCCKVCTISVYSEDHWFKSRATDRQS